jgi:CRP-like cAMP-binding protein
VILSGEGQGEPTYREKRERLGRIAQAGEFLEAIELFGYFESGVREILKAMAREVLVRQGQPITDAGEHHLDIFILKQGSVRVSLAEDGGEEESKVRPQPMGILVELPGFVVTSLFHVAVAMLDDGGPGPSIENAGFRRLSAVAEEDSVCVMIPAAAFRAVKERMPLQARKMVQVIFTRFQRITCSGVLRHLGLLDDLAAVEFAGSSNCTASLPYAMHAGEGGGGGLDGMQAISSMECLEGLQRRGVAAVLGALQMEASAELLESMDLAHEARVECVLAEQPVSNESVYYVSSGVVAVVSPDGEATHYVSTGGCLIVTSVLLGSKCRFRFRATTSCVLVRLERPSIMKVFERCPGTCGALVRLLVPRINGFLAFLDLGLNWIHVDAGTPVCFQDAPVSACYLVIHGRLRSVRRVPRAGDRVIEVGGGGSFGEAEIMKRSAWPGTVFAIRDSELVRLPRDLFSILLRARPSVPSQLARTLAVRVPFCAAPTEPTGEPLGLFNRTPRQDIRTLAILPLAAEHLALAEDLCTRLYRRIAATESVAILTKASVLDALGRHAFTAYGKLRLLEWLNGLEDSHRVVIYFAGDSPNSPWTRQCIRQVRTLLFMIFLMRLGGLHLYGGRCQGRRGRRRRRPQRVGRWPRAGRVRAGPAGPVEPAQGRARPRPPDAPLCPGAGALVAGAPPLGLPAPPRHAAHQQRRGHVALPLPRGSGEQQPPGTQPPPPPQPLLFARACPQIRPPVLPPPSPCP